MFFGRSGLFPPFPAAKDRRAIRLYLFAALQQRLKKDTAAIPNAV